MADLTRDEVKKMTKSYNKSEKILEILETAKYVEKDSEILLKADDFTFSLNEFIQAFWYLLSLQKLLIVSHDDTRQLLLTAIKQLHPDCPDEIEDVSDFLYQVAEVFEYNRTGDAS